jgi:serine/threonine-protein kinase
MSALAVAAALPGGDPLAAALAAGETPSPEMVAAAGPEGGMKPAVAVACLAFVLAGLVVIAALSEMSILGHLPMGKPLAALVENAREIIVDLGYDEPPVDSVAKISVSIDHFRYLVRESESIWDHLAEPGQLLFHCNYRQSPEPLLPLNLTGSVRASDPFPDPGDVNISVDLRGKLIWFIARPPAVEFSREPTEGADWSILFEAAGLDIESFEETAPTVQPRFFADSRAAWTGILTEAGNTPVRIEAAAYRGRPVQFERVIPSDSHWSEETFTEPEGTEAGMVVGAIVLTVFLAVLAGAVFLALRNLRLGRGDRRGATRLAAFVFVIRMAAWLIGGHHVADDGEIMLVIVTLSGALLLGALTWVLYMALEPYVRRLWPESLVGWTRLLAGRFRDPLVGRDLLVGMALGVALQMFSRGFRALGESQGWIPTTPDNNFLAALNGGRFLLGKLLTIHLTSVATPLGLLLFFLFLRLILRRQWIAAGAFVLLNSVLGPMTFTPFVEQISTAMVVIGLLIGAMNGFIVMTLLIRFGLLAAGAAMLASGILSQYPVTLDFSTPYVGAGMFGMLVVAGYALYGFRISLAGRAVFQDKILEERSA